MKFPLSPTPGTHDEEPPEPGEAPVKGRWGMLAACVLSAGVAQGFGRFTFPVLLPMLRADILNSYGGAGFIGTLNVGAYLVGAVLVMMAALRFNGHRIMAVGMVLVTAALFTMGSAQGAVQLGAGMFISGIGGALVWVPAAGVATSLFPPRRKGMAAGMVGAGIGLGTLIASQLAKRAPAWWGPRGWQTVWLLMAGVAVAATVIQLAVLHPPAQNVATDPPDLGALRQVPGWWRLAGAYFAYGFAYILVVTFMVAALGEYGFSPQWSADAFGVLAFTNIFGGLLMGPWSDRVGRRTALVAGFGVAGAAVLGLMSGVPALVLIGSAAFGIIFGGNATVIIAYLGDHTPVRSFASAFGALTVAFAVAQAVGPQIGGLLRDALGSFNVVFILSALTWFAGAVLAFGLSTTADRRRRRPPPPATAAAGHRSRSRS